MTLKQAKTLIGLKKLPDWRYGIDVFNKMGGDEDHSPGIAGRTNSPNFTGERHQKNKKFVHHVMKIDPLLKAASSLRIEKHLLRYTFRNYLPKEIVWRKKLPGVFGYSKSYCDKFDMLTSSMKINLNDEMTDFECIYNPFHMGCIILPIYFYGKDLIDSYRSNFKGKKLLITPDSNCKKNIKDHLELLIPHKSYVYINQGDQILDDIGLYILPKLRGMHHNIDQFVDGIKLVSWKFNLPNLQN